METSSKIETLGIIAGSRTLPILVANEARKAGVRKIAAVAFEGETDPQLTSIVDSIVWLRLETFKGGHALSETELRKSLSWFLEEYGKK